MDNQRTWLGQCEGQLLGVSVVCQQPAAQRAACRPPHVQVVALLEASGHLTPAQLVEAAEATQEMLLDVHDAAYLAALDSSPCKVARVSRGR